jgi:hypothetical protein
MQDPTADKRFYYFEGTWDNAGPGSVIVGHLAVDKRTADVWDAIVCREITSPALQRFQATVRRRMGITTELYKKLKRPGPMC